MDVVATFVQIGFRSLFLLFPVAVAGLAYRRLALSRSANAWVYAGVALFATLTAVALLPWAVGTGVLGGLTAIAALFCPPLWVGVVLLCDSAQIPNAYESFEDDEFDLPQPVFRSRKNSAAQTDPLMLERPEWPGAPEAMFMRNRPEHSAPPECKDPLPSVRNVLSIVREMRGNPTSEARRPRLLPPPGPTATLRDMPFIR